MLSHYKDSFTPWTDPIARLLLRLRFRPNTLTVLGFGASFLAALAFARGREAVAAGFLIVSGLLDFFDGSLARLSGQATPFGAFLDSVLDRYSDLVVLLGITFLFVRRGRPLEVVLTMAVLVGTMMVSYTKARAQSIGLNCEVGLMERPERLICLIAGSLLGLLTPVLWLLALLVNVTALQRIAHTYRAIRSNRLTIVGIGLIFIFVASSPASAGSAPARRLGEEEQRQWTSALEAFRGGDWKEAARRFRPLAIRPSLLADYGGFLLAESLSRLADLAGARRTAETIAARHPDSRLAPISLLMASSLAARQHDEAASEKLLRRFLSGFPSHSAAGRARYLLALSLQSQGRPGEAANLLSKLWLEAPASGYGQAAGDQLEHLAQSGIAVPATNAVERLERIERLLAAGAATTAREEAETLVAEQPGSEIVLRALRVAAGAWRQLGRYELAARSVDRALAIEPRPELILDLARLQHRAGAKEPALAAVERLLRDTPSALEVPDALLLRGRILEDAGDRAGSSAAYQRIWKEFQGSEAAGVALWRLAWMEWIEGRWNEAARWFDSLAALRNAAPFRIASTYWSGRSREALGAAEEARRFYNVVLLEAPRSYYGALAARRIGSVSGGDSSNQPHLPANPFDSLAGEARFARVEALRAVGLAEWAILEIEELQFRSLGDTAKLYGVSAAWTREARYHLALRILRQHFAHLALRGGDRLPRSFWEMFYPLGWRPEISDAAARAGLDPLFVAAVVREESSFYPGARSRAGARGLMQLMPDTARQLASGQKIQFGRGEILEDPASNLKLGSLFLSKLLKEFGEPRLAVAAYNAGPARVREWWVARVSDDIEIFVERIPFDETRHFVKRVMASWEEYRRVYDGGSDSVTGSGKR